MKILQALEKYPKVWHLTGLTHVLETDKDVSCRVKAGQIISGMLKDKSWSGWWTWLETREAILRTARRSVRDQQTPGEVRFAAFGILLAWDSFVDRPLLALLAQNPDFKFEEVKLRFHDLLKDVQKNEDMVPTLIRALGEDNTSRREQAAQALGMVGADAASAVPNLIVALNDKNRCTCSEAAAALGKMGPKAKPAIPALIQLFKLDILDYTSRREAGDALLRLDPEGTAVVPALIEILRTKNEDEGWLAGSPDKRLKENVVERTWLAAELLSSLGSRAKTAVPVLRELLGHQDSMVRGAAVDALKKIEQGKSEKSKPS
jgi:HEAT repeat protein